MRVLLLVIFIQCVALSVKAQRIIEREKYNLIIVSDTVCPGEDYDLTVDLKGNKNATIYRNGSLVPMSDGKGHVKFKAAAYSYDVKGMCKIRLPISVVIGKDSLVENITYVVVKPPMSNTIRRVQDSLTSLLFVKEDYKNIHDAAYYQKYSIGFAYGFGERELKEELGQLSVLIVVDSKGKVIKYDIVKNTYKTIPLQKIQHAIESYQVKDFDSTGNFKFSAVIYTVKGFRGNIIVCSER